MTQGYREIAVLATWDGFEIFLNTLNDPLVHGNGGTWIHNVTVGNFRYWPILKLDRIKQYYWARDFWGLIVVDLVPDKDAWDFLLTRVRPYDGPKEEET